MPTFDQHRAQHDGVHAGKWRPGMKPKLPLPLEMTPLVALFGGLGAYTAWRFWRLLTDKNTDLKSWDWRRKKKEGWDESLEGE